MPVKFFEQEVSSKLKHRIALRSFLEAMIRERKPEVIEVLLDYIFCSDEALHQINVQFLNHDDYTDIITFDLSEKADVLQGEIYISVDRVEENARIFNVSYDDELHRVIFHGALHLCGLGDKTDAEQKIMRAAENQVLEAWKSSRA